MVSISVKPPHMSTLLATICYYYHFNFKQKIGISLDKTHLIPLKSPIMITKNKLPVFITSINYIAIKVKTSMIFSLNHM